MSTWSGSGVDGDTLMTLSGKRGKSRESVRMALGEDPNERTDIKDVPQYQLVRERGENASVSDDRSGTRNSRFNSDLPENRG